MRRGTDSLEWSKGKPLEFSDSVSNPTKSCWNMKPIGNWEVSGVIEGMRAGPYFWKLVPSWSGCVLCFLFFVFFFSSADWLLSHILLSTTVSWSLKLDHPANLTNGALLSFSRSLAHGFVLGIIFFQILILHEPSTIIWDYLLLKNKFTIRKQLYFHLVCSYFRQRYLTFQVHQDIKQKQPLSFT